MWVMAIRSGIEWQFDPGPDDVLSEGDVLLVRGPEEGVKRCCASWPAPPDGQNPMTTTRRRCPSSTARWTSWWS